ncbi:hypothetical protein [Aliiglaciecola lipolytica]|nr:hypothetical protein [Aliiglaciecola lipolytica]
MLSYSKVALATLKFVRLFIFAIALCIGFSAVAQQAIPDKCIQLPERNSACPNILYKRSPVDVANYDIKQGEMMCICMADFSSLRIEASDDAGKVEQILTLNKASIKLNIDEKTLLEVIRK